LSGAGGIGGCTYKRVASGRRALDMLPKPHARMARSYPAVRIRV
jgi:hypothetical protein